MIAERDEVLALARAGRLIDVRTAVEFQAFHIPQAVNLPLDQFSLHVARLAAMPGVIGLTCHSGKRADQARALLAACAKTDVVMVPGGTDGWRQGGGEVIEGKPAMSLERQVRITAGTLVAIGAALALLVSPGWAALPLVVGSGLVFAGISDTCMMGMLLARMPWNRRDDADTGAVVGRIEAACSASR